MAAPNRLGKRHIKPMLDAMHAAVIAFAMGRGTSDHYHTMVAGILIADEIAAGVARHRHLRDELKPAIQAAGAIFDRQVRRTIQDAYWSATQVEIDALELAFGIYRALMQTTPGKAVWAAMMRVKAKTKPDPFAADRNDWQEMQDTDGGSTEYAVHHQRGGRA